MSIIKRVNRAFYEWCGRTDEIVKKATEHRMRQWNDLLTGKPAFSSARGLADVLVNEARYVRDPATRDRWQSPRETWARGAGDCEDLAALFSTVATANHIPHTVNVMFTPRQREGHVYVAGQLDGFGSCWALSNNQFFAVPPSSRPEDVVARQIGWVRPYHIMTLWPETVARLTVGKEVTG